MTKDIDIKIDEMLATVNKQKKEVEQAEKESKSYWKTHCSFKLYDSTPMNIQTANEANIRKALSQLLTLKNDDASTILGIKSDQSHDGYLISDWIDDFKKRIATIQLKEKKEKLKSLEERLHAIISPEKKRQLELDAIMKDLA